MSWNYRIVKYPGEFGGFGLHEVYYDNKGQPWGMTTEPAGFIADLDQEPKEIIKMLKMAIKDTRKRGVLEEPKEWPGQEPWNTERCCGENKWRRRK